MKKANVATVVGLAAACLVALAVSPEVAFAAGGKGAFMAKPIMEFFQVLKGPLARAVAGVAFILGFWQHFWAKGQGFEGMWQKAVDIGVVYAAIVGVAFFVDSSASAGASIGRDSEPAAEVTVPIDESRFPSDREDGE